MSDEMERRAKLAVNEVMSAAKKRGMGGIARATLLPELSAAFLQLGQQVRLATLEFAAERLAIELFCEINGEGEEAWKLFATEVQQSFRERAARALAGGQSR